MDTAARGQIQDLGLIASVVRAYFNPLEQEPLSKSVQDFDAWAALTDQAEAHRVSSILWKVLSCLPTEPEALSGLRRKYEANVIRNLRAASELRKLVELLEQHQIPAISFKGPALAIAAYNDLGMRSFGDLDLLLRKADVLKVRDILAKEGFQMEYEIAGLRHNLSEFTMKRGYLSLDLHWRLIPDYFPYQVDSPAIWAEHTNITIAGRSMACLSPEHQLLYLAAHGAKHLWQYWGWICDFAQCLRAIPVDWQRMAELTQQESNRLMLAHSLLVAQNFTGVALPSGAQHLVDTCPKLGRAYSRLEPSMIRRLQSPDPSEPGVSQEFRAMLEFSTRPLLSRPFWRYVFEPRLHDWQALHLPPIAYPLYYPFRILRLAVKYTSGRRKE